MKIKSTLLALLFFTATSLVVHAKTLYVTKNNLNATWPYTSWGTAAANIQTAVDAARPYDTVIVGSGTYDQGYTTTPGYTTKNRVIITKNITVHGISKTGVIITGQELFSRIRCVYMTAGTLENLTLKNGETLSSGDTYYDRSGGGAHLVGTAQLTDCVVTNCSATKYGGGIYGGKIENCSILGNTANSHGGGSFDGNLINCILSGNTTPSYGGGSFKGRLTDCTLSENSASSAGGTYAGTATNCIFSDNSASHNGGGSYEGTLTGCTFSGNSAPDGGGSNKGTLTDCTFSTNSATRGGGSRYGSLTHCTFIGNTADNGGGSYQSELIDCTLTGNIATASGGGSNQGTLTRCTLSKNSANDGGGNRSATLTDCLLTSNTATHNGGGTFAGILTRCTLSDNAAESAGGGTAGGLLTECTIMKNRSNNVGGGCYNAILDRCIISGNTADGYGGGVYGFSVGSSLTNCIITCNSAIWGGGSHGDVVLHNCTIKGNQASNDGGGCNKGKIYNSIIVDNHAGQNGNNLISINTIISSCSPDLTPGSQGTTNAPLFADVLLHLRADSPCIDSGVQQGSIGPDFDGIFRPLDGNADGSADIDMGAYEYASAQVDTDHDGLNDAEEVQTYGTDLHNPDTDGDGRTDGDEVASGFSPTYDETPAIAQGEQNVINDPAAHNLYTTNSIQDLNLGFLMLQATSNNMMHLNLQIQKNSDLVYGTWTNAGDVVEWEQPIDNGKSFFRIRSE